MKVSYPNSGREFERILTRNGFKVTRTSNGHYKAVHPNYAHKPPVWFAATPSDDRWARNVFSWIKRTYGINLKDHTNQHCHENQSRDTR